MPTVILDKERLMRAAGLRIDDKKLERYANALGLELEILDNGKISIEVTPNRPDMLSAIGLARALKYFMHRKEKFSYMIKAKPQLTVKVGNGVKKIRPYIAALVAREVNLDEDSLRDMINFSEKFCETFGRHREKIAMGMHDLDAVKPPIVYDAFGDESFVPLNESRSMRFSEILRNNEKGREYGYTISKSGERLFPALKDAEGVLSLIPIINSNRTKVSKDTKNLFIDITGTAKQIIEKSAGMIAADLIDIGAKVEPVKIEYGRMESITPKMEKRSIKIPLAQIEEELGVKITFNDAISLANKMGYAAEFLENNIIFEIPQYRLDILNYQDVVEDIAIAYGYDFIQPLPVFSAQQGTLEASTVRNSELSKTMLGLGFSEVMNTYLTNETLNFKNMLKKASNGSYVTIANAKTSSITMLRTWLIPSLMYNLSISEHDPMPHKIFELDMAFNVRNNVVAEEHHLACASEQPKQNFNDIKGVTEAILRSLNLKYELLPASDDSFIEGRCAKIVVDGREIGLFGEIHPAVLFNFGITESTMAMEINLDAV
ncbi:MAG: phenylalanine--tRNA ligase subunit beta [Candidatus Micrarchaeaceae archaeon]